MEKKFKIKYLPSFYNDLNEITNYISEELGNSMAAQKLLDEVENEILKRKLCPESTAKYISSNNRKNIYYKINVKNYTIFYIVSDNTMEIRRILYSRRNFKKLI